MKNPALARYKAAPRDIAILHRGREIGALRAALAEVADDDLGKIATWRNLHRTAFFSEAEVDAPSTGRWLRSIAARDDRILFLITTAGAVVGHIGLNHIDEAAGSAESDAWLGVGDARAPGIMLLGFAAMLRWGFDTLGLRHVAAQVFSDNTKVLRAHAMLGCEREGEVAFGRRQHDGYVTWEAGAPPPERAVTRLRLDRTAFDARAAQWR